MVRRLVILDPGLQGRIGHHFSYCHAIVAEAGRRGFASTIYAHLHVRPEVIDALPVEPLFRDHPYLRPWPERDDACGRSLRMAWLSARATQDLQTCRGAWNAGDVVLAHTANPFFLQGLIEPWRASRVLPRLVIGLQFLNDDSDLEEYRIPLPAFSDGATLYTHTRRQSQWFSDRFGLDVQTVPIPLDLPLGLAEPSARTSEEPTIGFFGDNTRADKGFRLLPDIVAFVLSRRRARFVIHAARDVVHSGVREALERLRVAFRDGRHTLVEGSLEVEKYAGLLGLCDIVAFPYSCEVFRDRESALLGESLALGAAACVPSGSSLQEECADFHAIHEEFENWTAEGVGEALVRLIDRAPLAAAERPAIRQRYLATNTIGRYFDALSL